MRIEIKDELAGAILDIGGGGEGLIGQLYGQSVTAIDNRQEELDEAPGGCRKLLMDATDLAFPDGAMDHVTFFYTLMYMTEDTQRRALQEAARVLRPGGTLHIWDSDIPSAYPEPFVVELEIHGKGHTIRTAYGVVKLDSQSAASVTRLMEQTGLALVCREEQEGQFYLCWQKPLGERPCAKERRKERYG